MKYMKLGNTDIEVSRICVGGMSFGEPSDKFQPWTLNEAETQTMIEHAYNLGVNFIDTANCYSLGTSEIYIGRALKNLGIPRDKVVLASKVYFNEGKLSRKAIHAEIDGTLKRLGTNYLDLYQIAFALQSDGLRWKSPTFYHNDFAPGLSTGFSQFTAGPPG